jgi:hypothetical protein
MPDKPDLEMGRTFTALVRIHEANCQLDYPTADEENFRIAIMKKLGLELNLAEVRGVAISGPGRGIPRPAASPR